MSARRRSESRSFFFLIFSSFLSFSFHPPSLLFLSHLSPPFFFFSLLLFCFSSFSPFFSFPFLRKPRFSFFPHLHPFAPPSNSPLQIDSAWQRLPRQDTSPRPRIYPCLCQQSGFVRSLIVDCFDDSLDPIRITSSVHRPDFQTPLLKSLLSTLPHLAVLALSSVFLGRFSPGVAEHLSRVIFPSILN